MIVKHHKKIIVISHKTLMYYLSYNFMSKLAEVGIVISAGLSIGIAALLVEIIVELYLDEQVDHLFASWESGKEHAEHSTQDSQ